MDYIGCNMGTCDLAPRARAYISGKSLVSMLQLLHTPPVYGEVCCSSWLKLTHSRNHWGNKTHQGRDYTLIEQPFALDSEATPIKQRPSGTKRWQLQ